MEKGGGSTGNFKIDNLLTFFRKCTFSLISRGPIPNHIAFIMDGNRRYARKCHMIDGAGHKCGFSALMNILKYCYELGVRYVTIYAFSIDNFKRRPEEVQSLMDLMQEKIEGLLKEDSFVNQYGIRVQFVGNLKLLSESVRLAAEKAMLSSAKNSKAVLLICVAYTSTNEILHAVEESCKQKLREANTPLVNGAVNGLNGSEGIENQKLIKCVDIEKNLHTAIAPDPDIIIRSSGESRLSNFLLWQSTHTYLYSPSVLWPEIGFRHLMWGILNFQRTHSYLEKKRKQL